MIAAVFDTNIFLQAILSETGPANACLEELFAGKIVVFVHPEILAEIDDFLLRPRILAKYRQVNLPRTPRLIRRIRKYGTWVPVVDPIVNFDRDPSDSIFLNIAIGYEADFLVSRDKDLLELPEGGDLLVPHPKLKIVNPYESLQAVRQS